MSEEARPAPSDPAPTPARPWWRTALVWLERAAWVGVALFLLARLGPQVGALAGVGPELGRLPALQVPTLDGDTVTAADLEGRVVVLNFWATWCLPCRAEMPALQALAERHADDDVVVLGLSTDSGSEAPIRTFLEERGITYPVGRATREQRLAFGGVRGIPTTLVVDRRGQVRHRVLGYFAPPAMGAAVRRLLAEEGP